MSRASVAKPSPSPSTGKDPSVCRGYLIIEVLLTIALTGIGIAALVTVLRSSTIASAEVYSYSRAELLLEGLTEMVISAPSVEMGLTEGVFPDTDSTYSYRIRAFEPEIESEIADYLTEVVVEVRWKGHYGEKTLTNRFYRVADMEEAGGEESGGE